VFNPRYDSILELTKMSHNITLTMILGGVILGIIPGVTSYFVTLKIIEYLRQRRQAKERRGF